MRTVAESNGLRVKAYAGSTGILLAMNTAPGGETGLLGFALERLDPRTGQNEWLRGSLTFPGVPRTRGEQFPTNVAPIQKYRWSDYRVFPDTTYQYTVHPVYGTPANPRVDPGVTVSLTTHSVSDAEHGVLFNRAAAASQAFSLKFSEVEEQLKAARKAHLPPPPLPDEALAWLSRGVLEEIVGFIESAADETWALDVAIYEYELEGIVQAINAAHARQVQLRVVYHAKAGDAQTVENEHNLVALPAAIKRGRLTSKIFHDKFIVLSRIVGGVRAPVAVLTGSTNFTHNGVYRQANVVHIVKRQDVAAKYLTMFEKLFSGADTKATRTFINQTNPIQAGAMLYAGFSPRSGLRDIDEFLSAIQGSDRDVLFCTAFDLLDSVEDALLGAAGDAVLRFGIQNNRTRITGFHRDRSANFSTAAMLSSGLEGFLKETTAGQKGNILIHTKLIVVDFTSDSPTVISGSHNFSKSASEGNDENFLILRGNTDIADCYGCELMRIYDHYRFRFSAKAGGNTNPQLTPNDRWTRKYFDPGTLSERDRLRFAGA